MATEYADDDAHAMTANKTLKDSHSDAYLDSYYFSLDSEAFPSSTIAVFGVAEMGGEGIILTPNQCNSVGAAYYKSGVNISDGFETSFE
jgi:hypothetical protein